MMNKIYLSSVAERVRRIIQIGDTTQAANLLAEAKLNKEEQDFVFLCLNANCYDPKSDSFYIQHADNSEFIKLVQITQEKLKKK